MFLNVYRIVVIFSCFVTSFELFSMDPSLLTKAVERKAPLHIVTLTRATCNKDGQVLLDKYPPISAAEAVTVFAIANIFFGKTEGSYEGIRAAHVFDERQFDAIEDVPNSKEQEQELLEKILENELRTIAGLDSELIQKIVTSYKRRSIPTFKATLKQDDTTVLKMNLDKITRTDVYYSEKSGVPIERFILPIPSTAKITNDKKIKGTINFSIEAIEAGDCSEITFQVFQKIRAALDLVEKGFDSKLKEKHFSGDPFLFGYLSISRYKLEYYTNLYNETLSKLKEKSFLKEEPSIFIANELFFGKNFVLPNTYPALIPPSPPNVLSCVNFLLSEDKKLPQTLFASEIEDDAQQERIQTQLKDFDWLQNSAKFFRSVSFYKIYGELVQEYTKSSYFQECDSALKNGFTYLFGKCLDFSYNSAFIELLSTQICYDLSSKARSQRDIPAPIHIFQSNTHNLSDALSILSHKSMPSRDDIPGHPKMIIHADPNNQEVFIAHTEQRFLFPAATDAVKISSQDPVLHYTSTHPRESFTFSIEKGDHMDSYTITHWILDPLTETK